jgi:hypothetical protein
MVRYFFLLFALISQPVYADMPALPGLMYVGEIPLGCERVMKGKGSVVRPPGFRISPDEAMRLAVEKANLRCNSILEFVIYADSSNYYIFHSIVLGDEKLRQLTTPESLAKHTIVVHGQTGTVVDNRGR